MKSLFNPTSHASATGVRAQNIIRFYEKAIKSQRQMVSLEKEIAAASALSGGNADTDPMNLLSSEFQEKIQQLEIGIFAALYYVQEHGGSVKGAQ